MKLLQGLIAVIGFSMLMACSESDGPGGSGATAPEFTLGQDYEVIRPEPLDKLEVKEYFSLFCIHCYNNEKLIKNMRQTLAADVTFERAHVSFIPQSQPKVGQLMSLSYATAVLLGVEDKLVDSIFDYHFEQKTWLTKPDDLRNAFVANGISAEEFDRTIRSDEARNMAIAMSESRKADKVNHTPDLVVNGKYRILMSGLADVDDPQQHFNQLVAHLLTNP